MSNCLLFALKRWMSSGGYVIVRKSHVGWWPHFLWSQDLITFEQFTPVQYQYGRMLPRMFFHGFVKVTVDGETSVQKTATENLNPVYTIE